MSSAPSQNLPHPESVILPSRLIPGMPLGTAVPSERRKLISIRQWAASPRNECPQQPSAETWFPRRALQESLLPAPGKASQRCALATKVAADFLLIATGFGITELLPAVLNSLRHAPAQHTCIVCCSIGSLMLYAVVFTLLGYSERLYHPETARLPRQQALLLLKVFVWATALMSLDFVASRPLLPTLLRFVSSAGLGLLFMFVYRRWRRGVIEKVTPARRTMRNVLIVGAGQVGRRLAHLLRHDCAADCSVRGFLDESLPVVGDVLGRIQNLAAVARREFIDEVIITVPQHSEVARKAIWQARRNHIDVKLVADLHGADPAQTRLEAFREIPIITLWEEPVPLFRLLLKHAADFFLAAMGLLILSPFLAAIAVAIRLDSPGPVLYRAPRVGLKGRSFLCYKFRTMVENADQLKEKLRGRNERQGPFFKMTDDPRLTRVGRTLRRYSLDEFPQLFNVLKGEMSLVGPRPHPTDDVQRYRLEDLHRLEVSPGLTGLWQVTARHDPSFERSMALDREYIGRWSLTTDFKILCKTVGAVVRGDGA